MKRTLVYSKRAETRQSPISFLSWERLHGVTPVSLSSPHVPE